MKLSTRRLLAARSNILSRYRVADMSLAIYAYCDGCNSPTFARIAEQRLIQMAIAMAAEKRRSLAVEPNGGQLHRSIRVMSHDDRDVVSSLNFKPLCPRRHQPPVDHRGSRASRPTPSSPLFSISTSLLRLSNFSRLLLHFCLRSTCHYLFRCPRRTHQSYQFFRT